MNKMATRFWAPFKCYITQWGGEFESANIGVTNVYSQTLLAIPEGKPKGV